MSSTTRALAFLVTLVLAGAAARAQGRDFSKVEIKVTKVAGNVYMLEGAGGNIAVSAGTDGAAIVDDQFAPLAPKIRAALQEIGVKTPVRFVLNTHYHGDHVGGNKEFAETATVIAHHNVRRRLASGSSAGNGVSMSNPNPPRSGAELPIVTFGPDLSLHWNGEEIRALHVPAGHTDGDVVVWFTKSKVVHMGDLFVRYGFPFVDVLAGGSVRGMIAGLEALLVELPPDVKVIPGHGQLSTLEDVRSFVKLLRETSAVVERELAAGRTLDELKKANVLEPWAKYGGDFITTELWLETLYVSLGGKVEPRGSGGEPDAARPPATAH